MSILAFGGEMGFFVPSDANAIEATGLGGAGNSYNSSFARGYTQVEGGSSYAQTPEVAAQTDFWVHFDIAQDFPITTTTLSTRLELLDQNGNARVRLLTNNAAGGPSATWYVDYWNGSAFVEADSFVASNGALQTIDIHVSGCNTASGAITLYMSGTPRAESGTIDLSSVDDLAQCRFYGITATVDDLCGYSQIIMANESTIGMRLMTLVPTGAGSDSAWTLGTYASVDELAYSDADFIASTTANQVSTFAQTPVGSFTGYTVRAVGVTARAKKGASGPTQLQLALRVSGSNYFSASKALDTSYGNIHNVWETSPATSSAWTVAEMSGLQIGVKSIA